MKKVDFSNRKIYVGIDVHKRQWNIGIFTEKSFHKVFQQAPEAEALRKYLERNFPNADYECVYESGFTGFSTYRELERCGLHPVVVHAADVPTKDHERRQKRDQVDARKLARGLRNGDIQGIYVPDEQTLLDRELIRYRCNKLVKNRTRVQLQIKSLLCLYGYKAPAGLRSWTLAYEDWIQSLKWPAPPGQTVCDHLFEEYQFYKNKVKKIDEQIAQLSKSDRYGKWVILLRTVPGVGRLIAMVLLTEIGDIHRFKHIDQLCHYVGLVPNVYASDQKEWVGEQTRRGNGLLRRMLLQSAWVAKNQDPALLLKYEELTKRMNGNKAIVRIQKKLLKRIRRVLITGEPYQSGIK